MELVLYHYQDLLYRLLLALLLIRMALNFYIYKIIESTEIDPEWEVFRSGTIAVFYYALTFWWPKEYDEEHKTIRLKYVSNVLNISFMIVLVACIFLFLYLQDANFRYRNVERDWLFLFKKMIS